MTVCPSLTNTRHLQYAPTIPTNNNEHKQRLNDWAYSPLQSLQYMHQYFTLGSLKTKRPHLPNIHVKSIQGRTRSQVHLRTIPKNGGMNFPQMRRATTSISVISVCKMIATENEIVRLYTKARPSWYHLFGSCIVSERSKCPARPAQSQRGKQCHVKSGHLVLRSSTKIWNWGCWHQTKICSPY